MFAKMHLVYLLLFLLSSPFVFSASEQTANVPKKKSPAQARQVLNFQSPLCFKDLSTHELEARKIRLIVQITTAAQKPYWDRKSLWGQDFLKNNPAIEQALKDYNQQKRGQSLRGVRLEGLTAQELHEDLLEKGFAYYRKPLRNKKSKKKEFWKLDGTTTNNARDKDIVVQIIYVHPDGSMVRVKPAGIPDKKGNYPRRYPHAVKAVLLKFNREKCRGQRCAYDTTFANEAFKVSRFNEPIPKSPSTAAGLYFKNFKGLKSNPKLKELVKDTVMEIAHTNLISKCDLNSQETADVLSKTPETPASDAAPKAQN